MYIEDIQAVATLAGGGTYNVPYFTALPDNLPGDVMIVMDGHPIADGVEATPEAAVYYSGTPRATVVAQEKCENCHEFLQFHGGNRNGNPQECLVCHNADGAYADEGIGAIAFGRMLHNIHAGKIEDFAEVTYPQSLANCTACHEEGTFGAAREVARPVSTDSGADDALWTDDLASSATAAACSACHDSGPSKAHMEQNGGAFDVLKSDIAIPSSATEACFVCHGDGKIADVTEAHGL
jgi:OmcA/MtrC family decaheme c-type cytochrome